MTQRCEVRLGGAERIGTHDLRARIVAVAVAPRGAARRVIADQRHLVGAPDLLDAHGRIAAVVARIAPQGLVLVEVLGRKDIDGQRFHARRHRAIACREDRCIARRDTGAGEQSLALRAHDHLRRQWLGRAPAGAHLRPRRRCAQQCRRCAHHQGCFPDHRVPLSRLRCAACLARLPQISMLHHRRVCARV